MKKIIVTVVLVLALNYLHAQVFNTGQTLKKGVIAIDVNPIFFETGNDTYKFGSYFAFGYGFEWGADIRLRYGWLDELNYFGADLEFNLHESSPYLSLTAGAHMKENYRDGFNPGLDGTLNITFPLSRDFDIFGGLDLDLDFVEVKDDEREMHSLLWLPVGFEYKLTSMAFLLEADFALSDHAYNIFGGGLVFYFR